MPKRQKAAVNIPTAPAMHEPAVPTASTDTGATLPDNGGRIRKTRSAAKVQASGSVPEPMAEPALTGNTLAPEPSAQAPRKRRSKAEIAAERLEKERVRNEKAEARAKAAAEKEQVRMTKEAAKAEAAAQKAAKEIAKENARATEAQLQDNLEERVHEIEERERCLMMDRDAQVVFQMADDPVLYESQETRDGLATMVENLQISDANSDELVEEFESDDLDGNLADVQLGPSEADIKIRKCQEELEYWKAKAGIVAGNGKGSRPLKLKGNRTPLASGLLPEFQAAKRTSSAVSVTPIGGLDDDDIDDTPPTAVFSPAQGSKPVPHLQINGRNMNRRNNLVSSAMPAGTGLEHRSSFDANSLHALRSSASEPSLTDATKSGPQRKSKQQLKRPSNRSPSLLSGPSQPSAGAHYGRTRKLNTKASSDLSDCCSDTNNAVPSPSPHIVPPHGSLLTSTTVRKRHLPPFAEVDNKWKDLFLATVTHALYISAQPFQDFTVSTPIMRSQIQRAIDLVYPEAAYSVKARGDPILLLSYNRLCELRAKIASDAVDLVVKHVRSFSSTTESHEWLLWARRLNGPLYFEDPTPAYCLSQRGSAGFIEPSGKLKSQFILTLVEHYLQFSQSAISDTSSFQPMVGLFGLVMAALERAVYIVRADAQLVANAKKFSHDNYGDKVDMFVQVVQGVSVDRWRELIEICSQEQTESDDDNAGPEAVGGGADHYNMFAFESPKKRRV